MASCTTLARLFLKIFGLHIFSEPFFADINECLEPFNDCNENAKCANEKGTYSCSCKLGYHGNGRHCSRDPDFDRVCNEMKCDFNAKCEENKCVCKTGFTGNGTHCSGNTEFSSQMMQVFYPDFLFLQM